MFPRVSIIILNWNGWRDTIECLESLYRITYPNYDVIMVDNGSKDDSIQKIKEYAEGRIRVNSKFFEYTRSNKPIKVFEISEGNAREGKFDKPLYEKYGPDRRMILIKNKDNYGFAGGNNVGIKFALSVLNPEYILLLNNDVVVDKEFLEELVKVAESDKQIGIVGPKIYYHDHVRGDNIVHSLGVKIDLWKGLAYHIRKDDGTRISNCDCVEGSCMLIKANALKEMGLFDEAYFAYWEETDLCVRFISKGYRIVVNKNAKIWHKISWKKEVKLFNLCLMLRNNITFMRKYANVIQNIFFYFYFTSRVLPFFTFRAFMKYPLETTILISNILAFMIGKQQVSCHQFLKSLKE
ncbi:glycosyl transferase family 2 [Thermococcus siculi]|uniref:Glycosyl transferase family 2 n=1 Tax=Thermococcus siculi TaxID=72803 RepID=A0A2Z2ML57_9EURY|nr:glycosyltransferase family 2 protein [Thermococcus siculi]ASJ08375.1 glycosyl transferase family 2 [Thermococcus siculi]